MIHSVSMLLCGTSLLICLFHSCKKENDSIGLNNDGASLQSASTDTFKLVTYSKKSKNTPSNSGTSVFIGHYQSAELGTLKASAFTSLSPTDLNFRLPAAGVKVNSVILSIRIMEAYGIEGSQEFQVYQTTSPVNNDQTYFTTDSLVTVNDPIGSFALENKDSGYVNIDINTAFGEEIIAAGDVIYTTSEIFSEVFKGLSIQPITLASQDSGCVYAIDADDLVLSINYEDLTSSIQRSISFAPSANTKSFYHTSLNHVSAKVEPQLNSQGSGNELFFIQGLGSVKGVVEIGGLLTWFQNGNFLINKAAITIPVGGSDFSVPTSLTIHNPSDDSSEGVQAIFNAEDSSYVFNVESLLSAKLIKGEEASFELSVLNTFAHPEQAELHGNEHISRPAELIIHYTEY